MLFAAVMIRGCVSPTAVDAGAANRAVSVVFSAATLANWEKASTPTTMLVPAEDEIRVVLSFLTAPISQSRTSPTEPSVLRSSASEWAPSPLQSLPSDQCVEAVASST
jgi:hypothetical protein